MSQRGPRRRQLRLSIAAGALVVCAVAACGDDSDEDSAGATPPPPATTTTTPAPRASEPPPPGPPLPFTTVSEVIWPDDVADLRATLDQIGVPDWWPMPDTVAPRTASSSTVQSISSSDSINRRIDEDVSSVGWTTWWLVETPDLLSAESAFIPKIPADRYDVAAGMAGRSEVIENGRTTVSYTFPLHDELASGGLYLTLKDATEPGTGERLGTLVGFSEGSATFGVTSPIPVGTAPARQFLGQAPVAPEMLWLDTSVGVEGGVALSSGEALFEPSGRFGAKWEVDVHDIDAVIGFLSDPTNFTGDLKPATTPEFITDGLWTLKVGYEGLSGEYSLLTTDPSDPDEKRFLNLEFVLPP